MSCHPVRIARPYDDCHASPAAQHQAAAAVARPTALKRARAAILLVAGQARATAFEPGVLGAFFRGDLYVDHSYICIVRAAMYIDLCT